MKVKFYIEGDTILSIDCTEEEATRILSDLEREGFSKTTVTTLKGIINLSKAYYVEREV